MKWNDSQTYMFVKEYLEREYLYDPDNLNYRNRDERLRGYEELAEIMNIEDFQTADVIVKIKNIRSTFCQEFKKVQKAKRDGRTHVPILRWYNLYYDTFKKMRRLPQSDTSLEATEDNEEKCIPKRPRKIKHTRITERARLLQEAKEITKRPLVRPGGHETEFDIFARNVGAQLNSMPTMLALKAQNQIQNYLFRLRLRQMKHEEASCAEEGCNQTEELYVEEYLEEGENMHDDDIDSKDNIL